MRDHGPFLTRRILALRQFPLFAQADLAELAMVAENVDERVFAAGEVVAPADSPVSLHLILDGKLAVGTRELAAHHVYGAVEVAARCPARVAAIAVTATRTLEIRASDYFEVLEDNFGLLLASIRDLAARVIALGDLDRRFAMSCGEGPLGLVERLIVLRRQIPFCSARLEALAILAHAATEVRWPAGTIVAHANAPADSSLIILDGMLRAGDRLLGPGHAVGTFETLAGLDHRETFEAATPIRALASHGATIHDVLEDHTDFALSIMHTFARTLVDHEARKPCASPCSAAEPACDAPRSWPNDWRAS